MKAILVLAMVVSFSVRATEMVEIGKPHEVKTYSKHLKFSGMCEVHPAGEYMGEKYSAFCSCVDVHSGAEDLIQKSYPNATKVVLPGAAWVNQPMDTCGKEPVEFEAEVQIPVIAQ